MRGRREGGDGVGEGGGLQQGASQLLMYGRDWCHRDWCQGWGRAGFFNKEHRLVYGCGPLPSTVFRVTLWKAAASQPSRSASKASSRPRDSRSVPFSSRLLKGRDSAAHGTEASPRSCRETAPAPWGGCLLLAVSRELGHEPAIAATRRGTREQQFAAARRRTRAGVTGCARGPSRQPARRPVRAAKRLRGMGWRGAGGWMGG